MFLPLIVVVLSLVASCTEAIISENRPVSGFTTVESTGPFIVSIDVGTTESLRIDANIDDANAVKALNVTVDNKVLKLSLNAPFSWGQDKKYAGLIKISITAITLQGVTIDGSGSIVVNTPLVQPTVSAVGMGSGNITLSAKTDVLSIVMYNGGSAFVDGTAANFNAVTYGAGGVNAENLKTNVISVSVYGAGSVIVNDVKWKVNAVVNLNAAGNVKYRGTPKLGLNIVQQGTGTVSQIV
ncbi:hypothetical protein BV898_12480 [Hypsibius exemplaris]|uniref:Putative auto-transporter adhesin head GIN domain-containing protein n=1 Tax=Hypsibius exemplaris TaxID=2072580 RepID=A0A1W0WDI9_HYPEX|nr:hypothetical protein BV898_12480 [Hypsibius exemplaris]